MQTWGVFRLRVVYRVSQETGFWIRVFNCTNPKIITFLGTVSFIPENLGSLKLISTSPLSRVSTRSKPELYNSLGLFLELLLPFRDLDLDLAYSWSRAFKLESPKNILWFLICLALTLFFLARCHRILRNGGGQCSQFLILQQLQVQNRLSLETSG